MPDLAFKGYSSNLICRWTDSAALQTDLTTDILSPGLANLTSTQKLPLFSVLIIANLIPYSPQLPGRVAVVVHSCVPDGLIVVP